MIACFSNRSTSFQRQYYQAQWLVGLPLRQAAHLSLMAPAGMRPHLEYYRRWQVPVGYVPPTLLFIGHFSSLFLRDHCVSPKCIGHWPFGGNIWYSMRLRSRVSIICYFVLFGVAVSLSQFIIFVFNPQFSAHSHVRLVQTLPSIASFIQLEPHSISLDLVQSAFRFNFGRVAIIRPSVVLLSLDFGRAALALLWSCFLLHVRRRSS